MNCRFELAEGYAEDDDAKHGINELRKTTLNKLNMHDSFVQVKIVMLLYLLSHLAFFFSLQIVMDCLLLLSDTRSVL